MACSMSGERVPEAATADFPWSIVPEPASREKRTGYLSWRDTHLRELRLPYIAVRGRAPGPSVAILAGIHGGEYPGILGALRLGKVLDPERVRGSLLIVPIANLSSFWERAAFITPLDGRNLNRMFPGRAIGTHSEVLALRLMQDIAVPADVVIDLHSGDVFETLADHVVFYATGTPEIDDLSRSMASAFGVRYALAYPRPSHPGGLIGNVVLHDKVALFVEVGGNAIARDDDIQTVYQGLVNSLRVLGMLGGQTPERAPRWLSPGEQVSAPQDGLWRAAVALEQQVAAGEVLGTLSDPLGNELARLTAGDGGIVLYYMSALAVRRGDPLVYVASG
jgi:uncharacterized protein